MWRFCVSKRLSFFEMTKKTAEDEILDSLPEQQTKKIKLRGWFSFFVLLISGAIIFGAPAVIFGVRKGNELMLTFLTEQVPEKFCKLESVATRTSLVMLLLWIIFIILTFFLNSLPYIVVKSFLKTTGKINENLRVNLAFIRKILLI